MKYLILLFLFACTGGEPIKVPAPAEPKPTEPAKPLEPECTVLNRCKVIKEGYVCLERKFLANEDWGNETIKKEDFKDKDCLLLSDEYWKP